MIYMAQLMKASATIYKRTVERDSYIKEREKEAERRSNMTVDERYKEDTYKFYMALR